jgi:dehydrogenase/reductase SDR family protein 4
VISSRNSTNVQNAIKQLEDGGIPRGNIAGLSCHVGNEGERRHLVDFAVRTFGRIDILVNSAAVNPSVGGILSVTENQLDKIFETNVRASFMLTKLVVPQMVKNG